MNYDKNSTHFLKSLRLERLTPMQSSSKNLFGALALEMGYLNSSHLTHALYVQQVRHHPGKPDTRLGQICVEMGYLTREQVEAIIESSRVRQLPSYLRRDKAPASRPV